MKKFFLFLVLFVVAVLTTVAYHNINRSWILFRKGETHFAGKEYSKAIPFYQEALKEGSDNPEIIEHLAQSHLEAGNATESQRLYGKLVTEQPRDVAALFALANVSSALGQFDEAVRLYREILKQDAKNRTARIQLARVLVRSGHFDEAIKEYRHVLGESA